ncbi:amidohydrolase [Streptomyces europaeiscabiei]|uniref:amidohydrolase n=1 Tax=Streptomyces europaeiscabiei TaxID=146819 RepID=UPI0029B1CAF0|nr:amidohydrolase [Streptomyces europaeiscabiei]MDX3612454.1 amidohydrolase [Streptomyces europaeiscabiei]
MVDIILTGGRVFGSDAADTIALRGDRVLAVGSAREVWADVGHDAEVIGTHGRLVMPGFQDAHVHPLAAGLLESWCDLRAAVDAVDALERIQAYARQHTDLGWIVGGGANSAFFSGSTPAVDLLDKVVRDRPVYLLGSDLHDAWVNSTALTRAGIGTHTPDPPFGTIVRDHRGRPTGLLHEAAAALVGRHIPVPDRAALENALLTAQSILHRHGLTAWQDALVGPYLGLPDPLPAYVALAGRGELTGAVSLALWWDPGRGLEQVDELCARREQARAVGLPADHVKIMQDGICENGWAALLSPYLDRSVTPPGKLHPAQLREAVSALVRADFSVHFHAVGDRAVRECLDAVQAAGRSFERRHHIAHVQLVADADLPRFAELDVTANVQPLWAAEIPHMRETYEPMLGTHRVDSQYQFASLARAGTRLAAGSDWPVSSPNPLWGAYVAVTRLPALASAPWLGPGYSPDPLNPDERIGMPDILRAFTTGTGHLHQHPATLTPGAPADVVVLDLDVLREGPDALCEAQVDLTIAAGQCVYDRLQVFEAEPVAGLGGSRTHAAALSSGGPTE